jgi:magnesium-transporting ATPase (P-type)
VDVLCFDKTGTLTSERITLQSVSGGAQVQKVAQLTPQSEHVLAAGSRPAPIPDGYAEICCHDAAPGDGPTAAAAVASLRAAGVSVVMITGDHPSIAAAIAEELGVANGAAVVTGAALDCWDDATLDATLAGVTVFARVTPAQKMRIVRAYQRIGRTVAMTGDGANDAPAIRVAHTGIALGGHGSPAARAAADLVVLDDRIETIMDAIVEGRAMWASVRDALAILVGGNLGEVGFVLASTAIAARGAPAPPRQSFHRHGAGDDDRTATSSPSHSRRVAPRGTRRLARRRLGPPDRPARRHDVGRCHRRGG